VTTSFGTLELSGKFRLSEMDHPKGLTFSR